MVTAMTADMQAARQIAEAVADPELPMLTLADLGILRDVTSENGAYRGDHHADVLGLPRRCARSRATWQYRLRPGRLRAASPSGPRLAPGLEQRLDHRRRAAGSCTRPASRHPARQDAASRPGPAAPSR